MSNPAKRSIKKDAPAAEEVEPEDVDVVLPKESCPKRMAKAPGRFIQGMKELDWNFVGKGVVATLIYWGISFGYMLIFLTWLYKDYKSQRVFNLIFFFASLAIVVVITLIKQYKRSLEDADAEAAMKAAPEVNVPKPGGKDWAKNKTGTFEFSETVKVDGGQEPIVHDELPQENAGRASTKTDRTSQYSHHGEF